MISKLWPLEKGKILLQKNIFFLPQNSYLFNGTLHSQISYPLVQNDLDINLYEDLLKNVKLGYLLERFNHQQTLNWPLILSPGKNNFFYFLFFIFFYFFFLFFFYFIFFNFYFIFLLILKIK